MHREDLTLVIDVGGDPRSQNFRQFARSPAKQHLHVYCVVNTKRPFTSVSHGILEYLTVLARHRTSRSPA